MTARKRKTKKQAGNRLKVLAGFLALLVIVAFGIANYFNSPGGRVFLLDAGFDGKFAAAQRDIGEGLLGVLEKHGARRDKIDIIPGEKGKSGIIYIIKAVVPGNYSLIKINNEIDMEVEKRGGRVRNCLEGNSGNRIEMEIGTRTRITHRCHIKKSSKVVHVRDKSPVVAVVVDDFGFFNNKLVKDFLGVGVNITISVIPGLKYSGEICGLAIAAGKDVLCHLPMEPEREAEDMGNMPVVKVSMSSRKIGNLVENALKTTPGVVGMNNHMGSKATADSRVMKAVLEVCSRHELLFFDSLTSSKSVASGMASTMGMPPLRNDIFLDNRGADVHRNMSEMMDLASKRGWALGIMHVRRDSFRNLDWMIKEAEKRGIKFVTLRDISNLI